MIETHETAKTVHAVLQKLTPLLFHKKKLQFSSTTKKNFPFHELIASNGFLPLFLNLPASEKVPDYNND